MINKFFIILLGIVLVVTSCDDDDKIVEINSYPEWQQSQFFTEKSQEDLFIFYHGKIQENLYPHQELKPANLPKAMPNAMKVGGSAILSQYLKTIKERFSNKAMILAFGDLNYFGSDDVKKKHIDGALSKLSIDGILLSKDDLPKSDSKSPETLERLPWFNSNILAINSGDPVATFKASPHLWFTNNDHKIAVLGITSYQLLSAKERNEISGFYFQDPVTTVLRNKNIISKEGSDLLILYYSGQTGCKSKNETKPSSFEKLPRLEKICPKDNEILNTLKRLPPGAIDLVISNDENLWGARYEDIPVLGTFQPENFISGVRLNITDSKINLKKSYLFPPIKLCHQVFIGTHDCIFHVQDEDLDEERFDILEKSSYAVVNARFLGHEVLEDSEVLKILNDK